MATKRKNQSVEKTGIEARIVDVLDRNCPTIITLYGRSGTGKTTIAATGPKPMLFVDIKDKGDESAKGPDIKRGDIGVIELQEFNDMYDIYDYLVENHKKYKGGSVVLDHLTALQEFCKDMVKTDEGKSKMSQQMFGFVASYMNEVISLFKNLSDYDITPIFLVQDRTESGEGDGEDQLTPEVGPGVMPSVSKLLCSASRVIGHTYIKEAMEKTSDMKVRRDIEYRLRLGPNPYYVTKVTKPKEYYCPPYVVNPTYNDIMKVIRGEYKAPVEKKKSKKVKPGSRK